MNERYQHLLKSDYSSWVKRGAYLYLLRGLPIDPDDALLSKKLLSDVGISISYDHLYHILDSIKVGIEHVDEVLAPYIEDML